MITFSAVPLDKYTSLHHLSLLNLIGIRSTNIARFTVAFNFNVQTPVHVKTKALLSFHLRDDNLPKPSHTDFCINNLKRWRMSIASCSTFDDYLATLKSNYKKNYRETWKAFAASGASLSLIDGDWSEQAETVYQLYLNVAKRHGSQLYDLKYFRAIAKIDTFKLICVHYQDTLISTLIIFDEEPVYHSMLVGFDYHHSKNIYAYSLLHYELIRIAIESGKHHTVDAGITANQAKSMMNFKAVPVCMDISARNKLLKYPLRLASRFISATINDQAKMKLKVRLPHPFRLRKYPLSWLFSGLYYKITSIVKSR